MKYFTSQDSLAIIDFREALKNDYFDPTGDSSYASGYNEYLDKLIHDFIMAIEKQDNTYLEVF